METFLNFLTAWLLPFAQSSGQVVNTDNYSFNNFMNQDFLPFLPKLAVAIIILLVGWIIARVLRGVVATALNRTGIGARIARAAGAKDAAQAAQGERAIASIVYYLIILIALVLALSALGLNQITTPLNSLLSQFLGFLPNLIAAIILGFIAYIIATIVRLLVLNALSAAGADNRLAKATGGSGAVPISKTISDVVFYLILLLFLPAILAALGLVTALKPVSDFVGNIVGALPNILQAAIILLIAYFIAIIVQRIVVGVLQSVGFDRLPSTLGLDRTRTGRAAADAAREAGEGAQQAGQQLASDAQAAASEATRAAAQKLQENNPGSTATGGTVTGGTSGTSSVTIRNSGGTSSTGGSTSGSTGSNAGSSIGRTLSPTAAGGNTPGTSASELVGYVVLGGILLFAATQAATVLGFTGLAAVLTQATALFGNVLLAAVLLALGIFFANLAGELIENTGAPQSRTLATFARVAILVLVGTIALRQLSLGSDIVNLAFGLGFGAIAVAFAISFGLGGRLPAERFLEEYRQSLKRNDNQPPTQQ